MLNITGLIEIGIVVVDVDIVIRRGGKGAVYMFSISFNWEVIERRYLVIGIGTTTVINIYA